MDGWMGKCAKEVQKKGKSGGWRKGEIDKWVKGFMDGLSNGPMAGLAQAGDQEEVIEEARIDDGRNIKERMG